MALNAPPRPQTFVGQPVRRMEDDRLLRGMGRYTDDIDLPGLLHVAFVRSPHAHALIKNIDIAAAQAAAGVHRVLTFADLRPHLTGETIPLAMPGKAIRHHVEPQALASREVCHVGEAIVLIVADTRALAEDAAALVEIDYEPLPAIVDPRDGLAPDAPRARLDCADNLVAASPLAYGDVDAALRAAPIVLRDTFELHKGGGHSVEGRGVVAQYEAATGELTVWCGTQMPHRAKSLLVQTLGMGERFVRVIAPDVGGGFGPKFIFYPEELSVPLAAKLLRRPLKWIEDRYEHFVSTTQERDQYWDVEVGVDREGRLLGIRGRLIHDHGAYTPYGIALPYNSGTNLIGPYVLPAYRLEIDLVLTNKVPATPTRGAGRPQGTYVMERLLDRAAEALKLDRAEIRRRNLIQPDRMPYVTGVVTRDGGVMTYDSGDYPRSQALALDMAGWADFPARQAAALKEGRYIGLGLANYVEGTGRGPFEIGTVRVGPSGRVVVEAGATAQGQGIATVLAQVCADQLGVPLERIDVDLGDTSRSAVGLGAFASRQAVTAGSAVQAAAIVVRKKILSAAAEMLEAAEEDLVLADGRVHIVGIEENGVTIADVARALQGLPGYPLPAGLAPGLEATSTFSPPAMTYCNGTHVVEVEVDVGTGLVRFDRYIVVHDCGRLINPMIVEGQIIGGVVHGLGHAMLEHMRFDETGQPLTVHYGDYHLPSSAGLPRIEIGHLESPTPTNPLGAKGAGESGTIPAAAVITAAIENALAPFGAKLNVLPLTPMAILAAIESAEAS